MSPGRGSEQQAAGPSPLSCQERFSGLSVDAPFGLCSVSGLSGPCNHRGAPDAARPRHEGEKNTGLGELSGKPHSPLFSLTFHFGRAGKSTQTKKKLQGGSVCVGQVAWLCKASLCFLCNDFALFGVYWVGWRLNEVQLVTARLRRNAIVNGNFLNKF